MTSTTKPGKELARRIAPALTEGTEKNQFDVIAQFGGTFSLIHRHTRTYHRLQEILCNGGDYNDSRISRGAQRGFYSWEECARRRNELLEKTEKRSDRLEEIISGLVSYLPNSEGWSIKFNGDPRGAVVELCPPNAHDRGLYDNFSRDGYAV